MLPPRPGDRLNGFKIFKNQLFKSWGVKKVECSFNLASTFWINCKGLEDLLREKRRGVLLRCKMLCFCFSRLLVFLKDPSCSHLMQTVFSAVRHLQEPPAHTTDASGPSSHRKLHRSEPDLSLGPSQAP